jgi:hypothetical protein
MGMLQADCTAYARCRSACTDGPAENLVACQEACQGNANDPAKDAYDAYTMCADAECQPANPGEMVVVNPGMPDEASVSPLTCLLTQCSAPTRACFGDDLEPAGMDSDCGTFFGCYGGCDDDDNACVDACRDALPTAEYHEVLDIDYCLRNSLCAQDNVECQRLRCGAQIAACFDEPFEAPGAPDVRVSCDSYLQCANSCPAVADGEEDVCTARCSVAFGVGVEPADALNRCVDEEDCGRRDAGPNDGFFQCILSSCQPEYDGCLPPGLPEGGVSACSEYFACTSQCDDRLGPIDDCALNCRNQTRPESFKIARLFVACSIDNECNSEGTAEARSACINLNCNNRLQACVNDGN